MKQKDIAKQFNVTVGLISHIKSLRRFTQDRYLAMEISRLSGKPAIEHIPENLRDVYLRAYPELSRKFK
jgi:ABC-type oligopeptide transport system ATPase subunit